MGWDVPHPFVPSHPSPLPSRERGLCGGLTLSLRVRGDAGSHHLPGHTPLALLRLLAPLSLCERGVGSSNLCSIRGLDRFGGRDV